VQYATVYVRTFGALHPIKKNGIRRELVNRRPAWAPLRRRRTAYARVLVFSKSCRHQTDANLQAIVDAGRGDVPLTELRFRCSRTDRTDFVVTSRDNPQP
jgi:hypothetical protein